jgi:hypothetical protein
LQAFFWLSTSLRSSGEQASFMDESGEQPIDRMVLEALSLGAWRKPESPQDPPNRRSSLIVEYLLKPADTAPAPTEKPKEEPPKE